MRVRIRKALALSALLVAAGGLLASTAPRAVAAAANVPVPAPDLRFDPTFPKTLPHHWILRGIVGLTTDKHDNVWILMRSAGGNKADYGAEANPSLGECCTHAPDVIEFSPQGDVLNAWGGPDSAPGWPIEEHTIIVDNDDHVWLAGAGAGDTLMEFTTDGKFLRDWGNRGPKFEGLAVKMTQNNQETANLLRGVSSATFDDKAREVFIADGYLNKRVMVYDTDTGKFKRGWGAYGKPISEIDNVWAPPRKPNEPPRKDFTEAVHCIKESKDHQLYVCDRGGNRVQVFTKEGKFVREYIISPETIDKGSVAGLAFSGDPEQTWMYVADMQNSKIWIVNRKSGQIVSSYGTHGYQGGLFTTIHIATSDSKGNLYVGELGNAPRVQKLIPAAAK